MQMQRFTRLSLVCFWFSTFTTAWAVEEGKFQQVNEKFDYEFYGTDVACWADKQCVGTVNDAQKAMAQGLDKELIQANKSVEFALYGVRHQTWFLERLKQLKKNGVEMRAVIDQDAGQLGQWFPENFVYSDTPLFADIIGKNKTIPDTTETGEIRTSSYMHNKFLVLDQKVVWLGSANLSDTDMGDEYSANVSLKIRSAAVAKVYVREFEQMYISKRFSAAKMPLGITQTFQFKDATQVSVYFSPQDNAIEKAIIPFINNARRSLDIGMFFLTDEKVTNAIIAAHKRGVTVRLIVDAVAARTQYNKQEEIRKSGIEVRIENWGGKMHMKAAVADGKNVVIGSMNWTLAGNLDNDENTVVVENNESLGKDFTEYFDILWDHLKPQTRPPFFYPEPEGQSSINSCQDGVDNDHDHQIDEC